MRENTRVLAITMVAACSASAPPSPTAEVPAGSSTVTPLALGMSTVSSDEYGAPRLLRAIAPRASRAGVTSIETAREQIAALAPLYVGRERAATLTTGEVQELRNGARVVMLEQEVGGVPIHQGTLRVLLHRDGSLAGVAGTLQPARLAEPIGAMTSADAVRQLLANEYHQVPGALAIVEGPLRGRYRDQHVTGASIPLGPVRAQRTLLRQPAGLVPVWAIELFTGGTEPHGWRYLISDTGKVLRKVDLIHYDAFVYRAYADRTGERRPFDANFQSFNPHPTGFPDGSEPPQVAPNLLAIEAFNGPRDPWLPDDATVTTGNNVDAWANRYYPYLYAWPEFDGDDVRAEVRTGRIFNYAYDFTKSATASADQAKAGVVNAFYVTNWLHDWYYDSGFTEVTGNAQTDNYGRGGVEGDPLLVLTQDAADLGQRDWAFMAVPADGITPHLHTYVTSSRVDARVITPAGTRAATFVVLGPRDFEVSGRLALAQRGEGPGCQPFTSNLAGAIALAPWDATCTDAELLAHARASGAVGVVLWSDQPGRVSPPPGADGSLPALALAAAAGAALAAELAAGPVNATLRRVSAGPERESAFDNTILAHEWGHYLHLRLNPCEAYQCGYTTEGWADFVALHLTLRPGDDRDGTFSVGAYDLLSGAMEPRGFIDAGYFGIRRYPYSVDRRKNPLRFRHIADSQPLPDDVPVNPGPAANPNSDPHNTGQVWATMLWDSYHALIDQHGLTEARRRMSDYAVAGLLMTPPDASFTECRDGILLAASALDADDMLLIAAAFAGRGMGSCARSPDATDFAFEGVVESGTVSGRLEATVGAVLDDGVSCDHDGYLDRGERGTVRVTVANTGVSELEDATVRVVSATPGVVLGAPVQLGTLAPFAIVDVEVPISIAADAPAGAELALDVVVDARGGCSREPIAIPIRERMTTNDVAAASTVDAVETRTTPWELAGAGAAALWSRGTRGSNHFWFGKNAGERSDTALISPALEVSATEPLRIELAHAYDLEAYAPDVYFDGGVVEVSRDDGATWVDASEFGAVAYPATIAAPYNNPLAEQPAFSGTTTDFPAHQALTLDFGSQLAGETIRIRFRIGTDDGGAGTGWEIDDVAVHGIDNTPFPTTGPDEGVCQPALSLPDESTAVARPMGTRPSLRDVPVRELD